MLRRPDPARDRIIDELKAKIRLDKKALQSHLESGEPDEAAPEAPARLTQIFRAMGF